MAKVKIPAKIQLNGFKKGSSLSNSRLLSTPQRGHLSIAEKLYFQPQLKHRRFGFLLTSEMDSGNKPTNILIFTSLFLNEPLYEGTTNRFLSTNSSNSRLLNSSIVLHSSQSRCDQIEHLLHIFPL